MLGIGLLAYGLGLIVMFPATLLDAGVQRASAGRLRIAEAQGTFWRGTGQIEIRDAGGRTGIAKRLAWRFRPASLLRGLLDCDVEIDQASKPFLVTISPVRIEIAHAEATVPVTALGLGVPKLAPLGLTGDLLLHVGKLSFSTAGRPSVQGDARLQWRSAGSTLTSLAPLGDYELQLVGEGAQVRAALRTISGPLQLEGKGAWASGANPVFTATARVAPEHQQQLAPLLRLIALERSAGNFELQLR
ncbi:MAG: type II secretion system protein N [Betaproteobacteria bacterium]|nr:type II secretion system protein N [Betaproteobacteria bacterium]MBI2960090.1 type II secretion system protein N [Betaproteobacteria bacterium]